MCTGPGNRRQSTGRPGLALGIVVVVVAVVGLTPRLGSQAQGQTSSPASSPTAEPVPAPTSTGEPRPVPPDPSDDPAEDPGVVSLVSDYNTSTTQAIQQMETQVAAGRAARDMPRELREIYSGRRIDHGNAGSITLALTDMSRAEELRQHFADYSIRAIDIELVQYNERRLDALAEGLQERLRNSRDSEDQAYVRVGRRELGKVTIAYVDGPMNDTEVDVIAEARADAQTFILTRVERFEPDQEDACDRSGNIECDPPLRGSVWVHNPVDPGTCTAGFNVRSSSDNLPYVLTAGHCHDGGTDWYTDFEDESNHDIGPFHNSRDDSVTDGGVLRVENPSGWQFGQPWITVNPNHGGHTANDTYNITDVMDPGLDDRVCVTAGNYPATTCGNVVDTNTSHLNTDGLFEVSEDLCLRDGDSGGPYFSYGVAYGIHIGSPEGASCGEYGRAEHALEAASRMNVYILTN